MSFANGGFGKSEAAMMLVQLMQYRRSRCTFAEYMFIMVLDCCCVKAECFVRGPTDDESMCVISQFGATALGCDAR